MVNATEMARLCGKKIYNWMHLPSTDLFLRAYIVSRKSTNVDNLTVTEKVVELVLYLHGFKKIVLVNVQGIFYLHYQLIYIYIVNLIYCILVLYICLEVLFSGVWRDFV